MSKAKTDPEYDGLKRFLAWCCDNGGRPPNARPESHPILILEQAEGKVTEGVITHAALKDGLREAVRDRIRDFSRWPPKRVKAADEALQKLGGPTLTELRMLFSGDLRKIEKRGSIQTEEEFRLVRNALETPMIEANPRRAKKLIAMLAEFEVS